MGEVSDSPLAPLLPGLEGDASFGSELLESEDSQRTRFSGKIVDKNHERVDGILGARAMGFGLRQICAAFHVSPHTVAELERRHAVKLATLKDRLARKFGVFIELGLDRAIREVDRMDRDKLMISLGIASDKLQVLTGEASVIVGSPTNEGSRFTVDGLKLRLQQRRVIDVTPTGSERGENEQTRELPALAAADPARGDNQSPNDHA